MTPPVVRTLIYVALCLLLAVPAGMLFGAWVGWALLSAALAWQLFFHLKHFSRLLRWSCNPSPDIGFEGEGAWDEVFGRLYRHEKDLRETIQQRDADLRQVAAAGEALTDGIVTLDSENRIAWCNTTAAHQLGLDLRTDRGQPVTNLVRQPVFIAYLAAGDFSRPLTIASERGGEVLSIMMLPYAGGNRLMQVRDVTQTERLDRMRRDFVANVSHELRTPLTVLSGFLETVRELELSPEERNRFLGLMSEQSARMQNIVQDLLTLSTLESSPPPPENERIGMDVLLDRLKRDAEALSGGRHTILLEADGADLNGAESELASAFGNLVSNAVRYTPDGGEIRIRWQVGESGAEFSVTDNGLGIDPKHIPRLTERFYRADMGRSRATGGTGLGLAIVKHALSRHQATLDISSALGRGSCFKARFPLSRLAR